MFRTFERLVGGGALALALGGPVAAAEVPALYREALTLAAEIDATEAYCAVAPQKLGRKLVDYARTLGAEPAVLAAMKHEAETAVRARTKTLKADRADCRNLDFLLDKMQAENAFRTAFGAIIEQTLMKK